MSKTKYLCPRCLKSFWAAGSINMICGDCGFRMIPSADYCCTETIANGFDTKETARREKLLDSFSGLPDEMKVEDFLRFIA